MLYLNPYYIGLIVIMKKLKLALINSLAQYPCDVVVLFMRHMLDFCCGKTCKLQDKIQETDK